MKDTLFWKITYQIYPPLILRTLEKIGIHKFRCPYHIGYLSQSKNLENLELYLRNDNFENCPIEWKDPGEILSLRKIVNQVFQYHIRTFTDGEIRGHFEYTPEDAPLLHIFKREFKFEDKYFKQLLKDYLI